MRNTLNVVLSLSVAMAAACGGGKSTSPTAPSASSSPSAAPAPAPPAAGALSGATISGTVLGAGGTAAKMSGMSTTGMTVSVSGTSSSSPVDAAGHFALQGVPSGHVDLHFSGAGSDAHLGMDDVTEHEDIHLTVIVSGATAEIDGHERDTAGQVEVEGRVAQISAAARTLRIGDADITVPSGTPIRHGSTAMALSDVHVGDRLHVRGTRSGTVVTATEVTVQTDRPGDPAPPVSTPKPEDDHGDVERTGTLSGRSGTCPGLTFTVSSTQFVTSALTTFEGTSCSSLADGDRVEVKGSKSSSGRVTATKVEKKKK